MAVPNGNNAKNWAIRRREPNPAECILMVGYGSVSTIAKRWVNDDGLANLSLLKVRSSPLGKPWGISVSHVRALQANITIDATRCQETSVWAAVIHNVNAVIHIARN